MYANQLGKITLSVKQQIMLEVLLLSITPLYICGVIIILFLFFEIITPQLIVCYYFSYKLLHNNGNLHKNITDYEVINDGIRIINRKKIVKIYPAKFTKNCFIELLVL